MPRRSQFIHIFKNFNANEKDLGGYSYLRAFRYPPIIFSDDDLYVVTTLGDRLDMLAYQFYKDTDLWWIIANANPDVIRRDSLNLKPGLEIRIPQNLQAILEHFKKSNI